MNEPRTINPIYADNAATTRLSEAAYESMCPFLLDEYGNPSQPYGFSRITKRAIREARAVVAECINANPEEIIFTSGGTESDNAAIKGFALRDAEKKTLVASEIEHHAVLNSCLAMSSIGHRFIALPVTEEGVIEVSSIGEFGLDQNSLVSCMLANNEIGTIEPISALCERTHSFGALFHTDAVQAVGHIPIDVKALGVDMLSASAHKFNGPRGIGFLYIKQGARLSSYASGGSQEMGNRAGTENTAAIVGLATALKESCNSIDANAAHLHSLESALLARLDDSGLDYRRNGTNHLPGLLSLSFRNVSGEMLLHRLDLQKIYVSTGSACNGTATKASHVLKAIGLSEEYSLGTIRISLGKKSTMDEVQRIASAIIEILRREH